MRVGASGEDENGTLMALCVRYALTRSSNILLIAIKVVLAASATVLSKENLLAGKYKHT